MLGKFCVTELIIIRSRFFFFFFQISGGSLVRNSIYNDHTAKKNCKKYKTKIEVWKAVFTILTSFFFLRIFTILTLAKEKKNLKCCQAKRVQYCQASRVAIFQAWKKKMEKRMDERVFSRRVWVIIFDYFRYMCE